MPVKQKSNDLVSVIMAAYNAEKYICEAINSILNQSHKNLEILVINDGSIDDTTSKILSFEDSRIHFFEQENKGVSAARNIGLAHMKGDFFCFLDADDVMPSNSLTARLLAFGTEPNVTFVDGIVIKYNESLSRIKSRWYPKFSGSPQRDLVQLTGNCFFGPTWLIRRKRDYQYKFDTNITHGEDLLFYISISSHGYYGSIDQEVLHYRVHSSSAMTNLHALGVGYLQIEKKLKDLGITKVNVKYFNKKRKSIMLKSLIANGKIWSGIKYYFNL